MELIWLFIASVIAGMIAAPFCKPPKYHPIDWILGAKHGHDQRRTGRQMLQDVDPPPERRLRTKVKNFQD